MMIEVEGKGQESLNASQEQFGQVVLTESGELVVVIGGWVSQDHPKYFIGIGDEKGRQSVVVVGRRVKILKAIVGYV